MLGNLFVLAAVFFALSMAGCSHVPSYYEEGTDPLSRCVQIPEETHEKVTRKGTQCTYTTDTIVECDRGDGKKERMPVQFQTANTCTESQQEALK